MYVVLPFAKCVKQMSKTFEINHLCVYLMASVTYFHGTFSSPKTDKKIGTFTNINNTV